jgi:hypothetical protein
MKDERNSEVVDIIVPLKLITEGSKIMYKNMHRLLRNSTNYEAAHYTKF